MRAFHRLLQSLFITLSVLLAGCGGGSGGGSVASGGIGGTGQIASGTITAFGSIFVNGIEFFDVNTANCVINGTDSTGNCQNNLQLGMVVKVDGTINGTKGNATQIIFDNDVDGPVSNLSALAPGDVTRTFTVLNTNVLIDSASTKFSGNINFSSSPSNINGHIVEVSGFLDNTGLLHATYVKEKGTVQPDTQVEIKGVVSGAPSGVGKGGTFIVNGVNNITVSTDANTDLSKIPGGKVSNGDSVEVKGKLTGALAINAKIVKPEENTIGADGDEVSIEGLITTINSSQGTFIVDGQQVDTNTNPAIFSPNTLKSQLAVGLKVEVEGTISGSTLIASKVEARGGEVRVEAIVSSVLGNTVTVAFSNGTLDIQANNQTQMEDMTNPDPNMMLDSNHLDINFINVGDFIQARAFVDKNMGTLIATELRRDVASNASKDILQGPIDSFVPDSSVTVLGITFTSDNNTSFIDSAENSVSSSIFYGALQTGTTIKIRDDFTPDGLAEEMSLEN